MQLSASNMDSNCSWLFMIVAILLLGYLCLSLLLNLLQLNLLWLIFLHILITNLKWGTQIAKKIIGSMSWLWENRYCAFQVRSTCLLEIEDQVGC